MSPQAASNLLRRWREAGLVDQVASGHYVIRQIGLLGTRAASEDVALAVGAFFASLPHRIAYRSALDHHGLVLHPVRTIQVACSRAVAVETLSGRRLQTIRESNATVRIEAETAGHGALVSTVERALLDGASRPELIGGIDVLATALSIAQVDPERLVTIAHDLDAAPALRRIGSLVDQLAIPGLAEQLEPLRPPKSDLDLEPREAKGPGAFRDPRWRMRWSLEPSELAAVAEQ
jgi:predicted transcriptional regulator of viral defense system